MDDAGRFEVSCLFYAGSESLALQERPWVGELVVDDKKIYLGQLPGAEKGSFVVTRYVPTYPKVLEFRVRYEQASFYQHPDEPLLLEELQYLLSDRSIFPAGGSAPNTNVHNRIKELESYRRVVSQHYHGKWTLFLANHPEVVTVHRENGAEMQIILAENAETWVQANADNEAVKETQEKAVVAAMVSILSAGDLEYRALLDRMTEVPEFTAYLSASSAMLTRFLQTHKDVFWLKRDPEHTTRVGLVDHP